MVQLTPAVNVSKPLLMPCRPPSTICILGDGTISPFSNFSLSQTLNQNENCPARSFSSVEAAKAQTATATAQDVQETGGRSYDYEDRAAVQEAVSQTTNGKSNGEMSLEDLRKTKSSPLVRNIAKEHNVDISRIEGSGMYGVRSYLHSCSAVCYLEKLVGNNAAYQLIVEV